MEEFQRKMAASSVQTIGKRAPSLDQIFHAIKPLEDKGRLYRGMKYRDFLDEIGNIGPLYYYNLWANLYREETKDSVNPNPNEGVI